MGSNLSDDELREAAAEAGISPAELRMALAERQGELANVPDAGSIVGAPTRGVSATHVEGRLSASPRDALGLVKQSIERQIGKTGHKQGDEEADIVDDDTGLTYRIRASKDGAGGSLVRVDVDPSAGKGVTALATTGTVGMAASLVLLAWLFSSTMLWIGGLGLGVVGGLLLARNIFRLRQGVGTAHAVAAHALMEADDRSPARSEGPKALPPRS